MRPGSWSSRHPLSSSCSGSSRMRSAFGVRRLACSVGAAKRDAYISQIADVWQLKYIGIYENDIGERI